MQTQTKSDINSDFKNKNSEMLPKSECAFKESLSFEANIVRTWSLEQQNVWETQHPLFCDVNKSLDHFTYKSFSKIPRSSSSPTPVVLKKYTVYDQCSVDENENKALVFDDPMTSFNSRITASNNFKDSPCIMGDITLGVVYPLIERNVRDFGKIGNLTELKFIDHTEDKSRKQLITPNKNDTFVNASNFYKIQRTPIFKVSTDQYGCTSRTRRNFREKVNTPIDTLKECPRNHSSHSRNIGKNTDFTSKKLTEHLHDRGDESSFGVLENTSYSSGRIFLEKWLMMNVCKFVGSLEILYFNFSDYNNAFIWMNDYTFKIPSCLDSDILFFSIQNVIKEGLNMNIGEWLLNYFFGISSFSFDETPVRILKKLTVVHRTSKHEKLGFLELDCRLFPAYEGFFHFVVRSQSPLHLMSIKAKILASKDPFIIARLSKSVRDKLPSYRGLHPQEYTYKDITKMGGSNSRLISTSRVLPINDESNQTHRNAHRLIRNGQKEICKRSWRQDRRPPTYETIGKIPLKTDRIRPKVPKRGTYIKNKSRQTEDKETSGESEKENKEALSTTSNSDSLPTSLPSRSDVLPPDGDSLRSDEQKSLGVAEIVHNKCPLCSDIQIRLTKANTEKGVLTVCLEKAQSDFAASQKKIKELEQKLGEISKNDESSVTSVKELEAEMCQLQKDKAILLHELHVTRKQLTRLMDQYDVSDSSHVSSVYVPGSGKDSDDDYRSLGQDDQDDYWKNIKEQLDSANVELNRLKDIEIRNEELESAIRHCEDRIIELQQQLKYAEVEKRDAYAQTLRRDGTFTRQPPDKTKIPKRLLLGSHSSLPVISDPCHIQRLRPTTSSMSRAELLQKNLAVKHKEIAALKNSLSSLEKELEKFKNSGDWSQLNKLNELRTENEKLKEELKIVTENYQKEMVMRKKYFNMAEEMKGKIRVFCRIKPSGETWRKSTFLEVPDEYSVCIATQRGIYEFTFDSIFTSEHTQDDVFRDVQALIQSALDGYNVCIFAYGQTGSGKTYTLIGTETQPGIGPRAFRRIFELVRQNQSELDFRISASFFELYNDSLVDLLKNVNEDKLKIRRDRYGLVYVQGSESREVKNEKQLLNLFHEACKNRHTGSTRMNAESSRSHLIVTVLIESTNKITGTVLKGKLSLVDLAGSERVGKTAAAAGQLKEASSINKSLSALGDVIAALSSEQQHVPYRNNKLTLLMQDSLGSNAKTLMFVTISSSDLNVEESLNSLTYASRVKQITNAATRMAESKEIARLRSIIMKLSKEERVNGRV